MVGDSPVEQFFSFNESDGSVRLVNDLRAGTDLSYTVTTTRLNVPSIYAMILYRIFMDTFRTCIDAKCFCTKKA